MSSRDWLWWIGFLPWLFVVGVWTLGDKLVDVVMGGEMNSLTVRVFLLGVALVLL